MQSRSWLNIGMLILVMVLAVTSWYVYQRKAAVQTLATLTPEQVTQILIPREQGDIILVKESTQWMMRQPYQLPAHEFRIQTLLKLLQEPVTQTYDAGTLDLAAFALNPPRARIRYNDVSIDFGKSHPVNHKRYLRVDNRVCLMEDTLYPLVSAEAASFVSVSLLQDEQAIEKIRLPELSLQKGDDQIWRDAQGNTPAADSVQQLLDSWRHASAFGVHAYMQRDQARPVTLTFKNGSQLQFLITRDNNWLIIGRPDAGVEYHLDASQAESLLKLNSVKTGPAHESD